MGNCFLCPTPSIPSQLDMVGTYQRVSCTVYRAGGDVASDDTPCYFTVDIEKSTKIWTMTYQRSNMVQAIIFRMPGRAKFLVDVIKVLNVLVKSTPNIG